MQRNRVKKLAILLPPCHQKANAELLLEQNEFQQLDPLFIKSQTLAQIGNFKFDFATGQVEWTPAMYQIYRLPLTRQALSYDEFVERIHPADQTFFLRQSQHATQTGGTLKTEIRILRGDHTTGYIQLSVQPWFNETGLATGIFGTVIDITSIKEAQQQLVANEERFRLLAENGSDMMAILSPEWVCTYMSTSVTHILGYQTYELQGHRPVEFVHPDDFPALQACFEQIQYLHHLAVPPYRCRAANGDWRWLETIITNYLDNPSIQGYTTTTRDITDRRLAELKIQESEQRYKSLFENHPDPVYSLNLEGQFMTANQQVSQILGCSPANLPGKDFRELIVPAFLPDTINHFYWCRHGHPRTYTTAVYNQSGQQVGLEVTNIPIVVDGQVTGIFGIARDITHHQKAREERGQLISRLEQKNYHLEQFASIVSHNLRAPVANIMGLTDLFTRLEAENEINQQVITNLRKSAEDLDAIVHGLNQVLTNRLELNQARERINLSDLLTAIQHILKEDIARKQVSIETDFTEVACIETVKSYLHNILLSLIHNAITQQDKGKPLAIKIKTTRVANRICLTIQDNSLNLKCRPMDTFESFPQGRAKEAENGLLFQIIRTQVEILGGKAEMESRPGAGTTFKLYLMH